MVPWSCGGQRLQLGQGPFLSTQILLTPPSPHLGDRWGLALSCHDLAIAVFGGTKIMMMKDTLLFQHKNNHGKAPYGLFSWLLSMDR